MGKNIDFEVGWSDTKKEKRRDRGGGERRGEEMREGGRGRGGGGEREGEGRRGGQGMRESRGRGLEREGRRRG